MIQLKIMYESCHLVLVPGAAWRGPSAAATRLRPFKNCTSIRLRIARPSVKEIHEHVILNIFVAWALDDSSDLNLGPESEVLV